MKRAVRPRPVVPNGRGHRREMLARRYHRLLVLRQHDSWSLILSHLQSAPSIALLAVTGGTSGELLSWISQKSAAGERRFRKVWSAR